MKKVSYLGSVGSEYNNAELVAYLKNLGMVSNSFEVSVKDCLELINFCMENDFWFAWDGKELIVSESKGFYIEF